MCVKTRLVVCMSEYLFDLNSLPSTCGHLESVLILVNTIDNHSFFNQSNDSYWKIKTGYISKQRDLK